MNWIYRHKISLSIIFFGFMLLLPILINWFSQIYSPFTILHDPSTWLTFWGVYLAAIASMGMIIITSFSIYNNNQQQLRSLKYQSKLDWINQLKRVLIEVVNSFDENIINEFLDEFNTHPKRPDFKGILIKAETKIRNASYSLDTILLGCPDTVASKFMDIYREKKITYQIYLDELAFLLQFHDEFQNSEDLPNKEYFKRELEKFKKCTPHFKDKPNPDRIWEIAKEFDYKLISKREDILHRMHFCADSYLFRKSCAKFINEEIKNADNILNGTEQNK